MSKLQLPNVTLVAMTSVLIQDTIKALMFSSEEIEFARVLLVSHELPDNLPSKISFSCCNRLSNIDEWNHDIIFELHKHIDTDFIILIHDDGFVVNPSSWRDDFLSYDYIGAPWGHKHMLDFEGKVISVGNSVSLRSRKLLEIPTRLSMPWVRHDGNFNEDTQICVWNRNLFLSQGIKFADFDVAKYFSHETYFEEFENIKPFCFHNFGGPNSIYKELIENYKF